MNGEFSNNSGPEVLTTQSRAAAIELLQAAIVQGLESGEPAIFDVVAFKQQMRQRRLRDISVRAS